MSAPTTPTEAIVGKLLADNGVTALVGTAVFPILPTENQPGAYIAVAKTAGGGGMRLGRPTQLNQYSMRVDCYAATEAAAEAILKACVNALAGLQDRANGIQAILPTEDANEEEQEDEGGGVYKVSGQTFSLWFLG